MSKWPIKNLLITYIESKTDRPGLLLPNTHIQFLSNKADIYILCSNKECDLLSLVYIIALFDHERDWRLIGLWLTRCVAIVSPVVA